MSLSICFKKLNNQELDIDGYFFIEFFLLNLTDLRKKALIYLCFVWPANHLQFLSNITNIMTMILMFVMMMMMMMMTKPDRETEEKTSLSDSLLFSPLGSIWCWESFCFITFFSQFIQTFSSVFLYWKECFCSITFCLSIDQKNAFFFNIQKHSVLREFYHF